MKRLIPILLVWLIGFGAMHAQTTFTAKAPFQVEVGETFRVQFEVTTDHPEAFKGPYFDKEGFDLLDGPKTSSYSSYQVINGVKTSNASVTYTYTVCARKKGKYTIPEAQVMIDGQQLSSEPITIEVVAANSLKKPEEKPTQIKENQEITDSDLFVTVSLSKKQVKKGEKLTVTFKLYTLVDATSTVEEKWSINNCNIQVLNLSKDKVLSQEKYKGKEYYSGVLSQYTITPLTPGIFKIPSIHFTITIQQRVKSSDPLDAFFNVGSSYIDVEKTIQTPATEFVVTPL